MLIPVPSLVLLIGPSGAGKSTFAARRFGPFEIVSSDHCRALITDDESDQSVSAAAFGLLHHIVRLRLQRRRLTVVDATNVQYRARRPLLRLARQARVPLVAIVFQTTLAACLAHNRARTPRLVPEAVIRQHHLELERALLRLPLEGYQHIYLLAETGPEQSPIERYTWA
jgi:protein phosphatase